MILAGSFDSEAEQKSLLCSLLSLSENDENDPEWRLLWMKKMLLCDSS